MNKKQIKEEILQLNKNLGHFPTAKELSNKLLNSIYKNGYKLSDFGSPRKGNGYWNFSNLCFELRPLIVNNQFPTFKQIRNKISSGACAAIAAHGGINEVANKMGCEVTHFYKTNDGHIVRSVLELLVDEYLYSRDISHTVDGLIPNSKYRYDFLIEKNIYVEIWGFNTQEYQIKRIKKELLYKNKKLNLCSIELSDFDNMNDFESRMDSIFNHFKISTKIIRKCDLITESKNYGLWNENRIIDELNDLIHQFGYFPSQKEIQKLKNGLCNAIAKRGGLSYFQEKIGFKLKNKPLGYWSEEVILETLKKLNLSKDEITANRLRKDDFGDLVSAMSKRNGIQYYKNKL